MMYEEDLGSARTLKSVVWLCINRSGDFGERLEDYLKVTSGVFDILLSCHMNSWN